MIRNRTWKRILSICLTVVMCCSILPTGVLAALELELGGPQYPYQDTSLSFEERAADLVSRMTLEEKISQLQDGRNPNASAIPRLGVNEYRWWSEALHGVARNGTATSFPTGLGIAATWDTDLVEQMMKATSDEVREKYNFDKQGEPFGLAQWSPTINMARDPRWGRAEESYGEDPYLTGQIAEAFIDGLQGAHEEGGDKYLKTMATPKHFLGNNSESNRHNGSANIDERDLREYYTYAFKNAIENGKAESIMTSYNAVNGVPMSVNTPILEDLLRRTWGFDGYVTTDCDTLNDVINRHSWRPDDADWDTGVKNWDGTSWGGKEATAYALKAGVDANCGTTIARNAKAALDAGLITEDDIDKTLVRLFTARMKTGEFDDPDSDHGGPFGEINNVIHSPENQALAEKSSDNAVVLLKNEAILPLGTTGIINSLVLVGPRADELELGDYSTYEPQNTSTALEGIQAAYKRYCAEQSIEGSFRYIPGASASSSGNYLMNIGALTLHDGEGAQVGELKWSDSSEQNGCKVEGGGNLGYMSKGDTWVKFDNVDFTNVKTVKVKMAGDTNAARTTMEIRVGSPTGQLLGSTNAGVGDTGGWQSYQTYEFEFTGAGGGYDGPQTDVYFVFKETVATGSGFTEEEQDAISAADVVVFFAGTKQGENGYFENTDGYNLNLPGGQTEMIQSVAGLNENTIVYIQAVSQINIEPFKDDVKGIFWSTYNGQAQGNAAGRLLFGEANPSAKLPFSWYTDINDLANVQDYQIRADGENQGRTYQYFTGDVTYPFGYGLSYSQFEYSNLTIDKDSVTPDDTITVEFDVTNTSDVDGQEVAELYVVSPNAAENDRPAKRLKGFDKQEIAAGETVHFSIELPVEDLWYWDADNDVQTYDQGEYTIQVGSDSESCEDLTATFNLSGSLTKHLHAATAMPSGHILDTAKPDKTITTDLSASYNDQTFVDLESAVVTYTSSKPNVATVDENGVVTAVGGGVTTITATVQVGDETITDTYPVVVLENIAATGITVDGEALPGFAPDVTEYTVTLDSFDTMPVVAATSTEGVDVQVEQATAEHPTATITLTKGEVTMTYTVTFYMELQSFDFTTATKEDLQSTWSVVREDASKWSLDENGLTITTEKGDLYTGTNTAKNMFMQNAPGDWEVQVQIVMDKEPTQNYQQVSMLAYQDDNNYLKIGYQGGGKSIQMNRELNGKFTDTALHRADFSGTNVWFRLKKSGNTYTGWYSSDGKNYTELGSADANLNNIKLAITANSGTKDADPINVTFKNFQVLSNVTPVTGVKLDKTSAELKVGETLNLTATVEPENATNKNVTWTTSSDEIATVGNGTVTAVAEGTATITVTTEDGSKTAACTVTVAKKDDGGSSSGGGSSVTRYTITVKQTEGGKISPSTTSVIKGNDKTFTIKADEGYEIADVLVDGKSVGAVERYTFEEVRKGHTIQAIFEKAIDDGDTPLGDLSFNDVEEDDWYAEAVLYAVKEGLMKGTSEDTFSPKSATTRGMIVTILYRQAGSPAVESDGASWWSDGRAWAMAQGISDGTNMDQTITREQLATMLYRYAGEPEVSGGLTGFSDGTSVSSYAADAMAWAVETGLITGMGDGTLNPRGQATRAQVATILMRFCEDVA